MATVQTLKDKSNNTFYPVTKTEAVYNADGTETLDNLLTRNIVYSHGSVGSSDVSVTTTETTLSSGTINTKAGKLLIFGSAVLATLSATGVTAYIGVYVDNTRIILAAVTGKYGMTTNQTGISGATTVDVTAGSHTVSFVTWTSTGTAILPAASRRSVIFTEL